MDEYNEYDIVEIFKQLEFDLVSSMSRTIKRHLKEEEIQELNWSQWQSEMLKGLSEYRARNAAIVGQYDERVIRALEVLLVTNYTTEALTKERIILKDIVKGAKVDPTKEIKETLKNIKGKDTIEKVKNVINLDGTFFKVNDRKLNALIKESKEPIQEVTKSILRYQDDIYRQVIYKAQVYANVGAKTIEQCVDMASKEFLQRGITNIVYKDGKKVNIVSYAELCIRNSNKKARLVGQGEVMNQWGEYLALISQHSGCCSKYCLNWQGKVVVDDVYANGKDDGKHPLLSTAISQGLYHPNCKHSHSIFFEGINKPPKPIDTEKNNFHYKQEQKQRYLERKVREKERLMLGSVDETNKNKYKQEWKKAKSELSGFVKENGNLLQRQYWRESSIINKYKPIDEIKELKGE